MLSALTSGRQQVEGAVPAVDRGSCIRAERDVGGVVVVVVVVAGLETVADTVLEAMSSGAGRAGNQQARSSLLDTIMPFPIID